MKRIQSHTASRGLLAGCMLLAACILIAACRQAWAFQNASSPPRALVRHYCVGCHNQKLKTANIELDTAAADHVFNSAETWEKVIVKLRSRSMPPAGMPRPDNATYDSVVGWLE